MRDLQRQIPHKKRTAIQWKLAENTDVIATFRKKDPKAA
jgi:hypothetical protein